MVTDALCVILSVVMRVCWLHIHATYQNIKGMRGKKPKYEIKKCGMGHRRIVDRAEQCARAMGDCGWNRGRGLAGERGEGTATTAADMLNE